MIPTQKHSLRATVAHALSDPPRDWYVAWCSCGMGSPLKATPEQAVASLKAHIDNPKEFPK